MLHDIRVVVVDGGKGSGSGIGGDDDDKKKKPLLYRILNYNQTIKNKIKKNVSPTSFFAIQQGIGLATQVARQAVNFYVSDIGRANGDSNYQALINRKIEIATDIAGLAQGAFSGAAAGSMLGPIGAVVGMAAGAISSTIGLGFKYAERQRAYAHEMFKEDTRQSYNLARADYSRYVGRKW